MNIRIATYNVHNTDGSRSIVGIADEIKTVDANFVGLQEIDVGVERSQRKNTLGELNKICGYPSAIFSKSIDYDGGEYGIGAMFGYPLVSMQKYMLPSATEQRLIVKLVLETEVGYLSFFNTHLSYRAKDVRVEQLKFINSILSKEKRFIMTGDFNIEDFDELSILENVICANNAQNPHNTFKDGGCIDNIIVSENIKIKNVRLCESEYSDHNMLIADITL